MEKENKKPGFFARIKIAVTKLEDYGLFLEEKLSVAVKYFFLIVLLLATVMAIVETYRMMQMVSKGYQYIQNEMPDFSFENEILNFTENINAYDTEFDFYMIADTNENIAEEKMKEYNDTIKSTGAIFLKDKVIYKTGSNQIEYTYHELVSQYGFETFNKTQLLERLDAIGMTGIAFVIFITIVFGVYIIQLVSTFIDWLVISIFAVISARICGMRLSFKGALNLSIYALTLSIILSMLYQIAYYLVGFYTDYFRVVYLLIAYVYVVAVILMIKSDLLKQQVEVAKIVEIQNKVKKELEDSKEKEEKKNENQKPEKDKEEEQENQSKDSSGEDTSVEPDGSEI